MLPDSVLGNTFKSFFQNFFRIIVAFLVFFIATMVLIVVFVLVGIGPENLLGLIKSAGNPATADPFVKGIFTSAQFWITMVVGYTILIIISIMFGIFMKLLAAASRTREVPQYSQMMSIAWLRTWKIFKIGLTLMVPAIIAILMAFIPLLGTIGKEPDPTQIIAFVLLFLVLFIALIPLYVRLCLSTTVGVLEDLGVFDSIKRSWKLTQGAGWLIFAYCLVIYVFIFAVNMVMQLSSTGMTVLSERLNPLIMLVFALLFIALAFFQAAAQQIIHFMLYYIYFWRTNPPVPEVSTGKNYFFAPEYCDPLMAKPPIDKPDEPVAGPESNQPEDDSGERL